MLDMVKLLDKSNAGELQRKLEQAEKALERHSKNVSEG